MNRTPWTRCVAALAALVALCLTMAPVTAQAEGVDSAEQRVAALRGLQERTTQQLLAGTKKWEADQRKLRLTRVTLRNTQRRVREAQGTLSSEQARVSAIARNLYQNPTPTGLQLALTRGPDEVLGALQALSSLDKAAGSQAQLIARAATARHRLSIAEADARRLEKEAEALTKASAKRLTELQALAQSTAEKLSSAEAALSSARAARRAALARAAAARASRSRPSGGALCSRRSTSGQSNGNLDPASLCPLWGAPGHRLRFDAAQAFNRMSKFHAATVGGPLCVTDSYRSYSEQVDVYRRKPGLAAVPGTSEHGWGKAVDFCGGVQNSRSAAHRWMQRYAGRFGWFHPAWAEPSGSRPEPWHWEFSG